MILSSFLFACNVIQPILKNEEALKMNMIYCIYLRPLEVILWYMYMCISVFSFSKTVASNDYDAKRSFSAIGSLGMPQENFYEDQG